jgi:hypothetical protein
LLHTVGFLFSFPFQVLSVLLTKPTDSTREMERETGGHRERQRECGRVSARGFRSTWYLFPPASLFRARGGGGEREFIGPLLSANGYAHTHTHTHTVTLRTHAQITGAAAAAAMHKDTGLTHRLTDVALALHAIGCDSCPCPRKPMLCQYLVLRPGRPWGIMACKTSLHGSRCT